MAEETGVRRLMILVGSPEAQSIAFKLHKTEPPRPLTHDLIKSILFDFDILLEEVVIYKYEDGIFYSRLYLNGAGNKVEVIESRTSDAIATALRTNSPIYTTEDIMREQGVVVSDEDDIKNEGEGDASDDVQDFTNYSDFNRTELENMLEEAIKNEDYELASVLRDEISKRTGHPI
nr:bifunctional nuclease family protein [Dysgonomonas sp. 216]